MGVDPMSLIRAQRSVLTPAQGGNMVAHPGVVLDTGQGPQTYRLPQGPGDPGYRERIPPPDKIEGAAGAPPVPTAVELLAAAGASLSSPQPDRRLVVTFGRVEGQYVVGIEVAPSWNVERSYRVSAPALAELLPVLRELVPLKDLTGGDLQFLEEDLRATTVRPEPTAPPLPPAPADGPGPAAAAPPESGDRGEPAGAPDGAAGSGDAAARSHQRRGGRQGDGPAVPGTVR